MLNKLEKRIIDISYKQGLSHIGSCLSVINILDEIYSQKKPNEKVVLDGGHSHLAHMIIKEKYEDFKVPKVHDIHCNKKDGCDVPTGSLGMGLGISCGMALADRSKRVFCIVTDGSMMEGSNWEALRIADELELDNLKIYCVANGYGAYKKIDPDLLEARINLFNPRVMFKRINLPKWSFITDLQEMHYRVLSKSDYEELTK